MASIELDWANDDCFDGDDGDPNAVAARYGLTATIVNESGPGGGWPVYRFTGRREDLGAFLYSYEPDAGNRNDLIDTIEEE